MITSLAPRHWQGAVVDALGAAHHLDRDDARAMCWRLRFPLTALHNDGGSPECAALWVSERLKAGPRVLNKRWDAGASAVYIGRGSKWGNPYRLGVHGDRQQVVDQHERWLRSQHQLLRVLGELRGRHLLCFRSPLSCHGDLLRRLANGSREQLIAWWRCEAA